MIPNHWESLQISSKAVQKLCPTLKVCQFSMTVKKVKLLKKLPEWMVRRLLRSWINLVIIPAFYASLISCKEKPEYCVIPSLPLFWLMRKQRICFQRAKTLNTHTQLEDLESSMTQEKPKPPCLFCKNEEHGVAKCPTLAAKPMEEKRAFVFKHHLCFGCLRNGHASKDCRKQHICNTCGRRHHKTCVRRSW